MALTNRRSKFADEYLVDLNAAKAAMRAGQSARTAQQLLQNASVQGAIQAALAARAERTEISQNWVIGRLVANAERAMQAVPVCDAAGKETGRYTYQGTVANRALELLGKHIGMWTEHRGGDLPKPIEEMDADELRALLGRGYLPGERAGEDHPPTGVPPTRKLN